MVSEANLYTKSELGAVATSRALNFPEVWKPLFWPHFHELTLRLVATAPSSDFVLPNNSIPLPWIRLLCNVSPKGEGVLLTVARAETTGSVALH